MLSKLRVNSIFPSSPQNLPELIWALSVFWDCVLIGQDYLLQFDLISYLRSKAINCVHNYYIPAPDAIKDINSKSRKFLAMSPNF